MQCKVMYLTVHVLTAAVLSTINALMPSAVQFEWHQLKITDAISVHPQSRSEASVWYDATNQTLWLYGGVHYYNGTSVSNSKHQILGDLWTFTHTPRSTATDGITDDTTVGSWQDVSSLLPVHTPLPITYHPPSRYKATLCGIHAKHSKYPVLAMYGGVSEVGAAEGDTWVFDREKLTWIPIHYSPASRRHCAHWCLHDRLVIYGGMDNTGAAMHDMWQFRFTDLNWTRVDLSSHPGGLPDLTAPPISWHDPRSPRWLHLINASVEHTSTHCVHAVWSYNMYTRHWSSSTLVGDVCTGIVDAVSWLTVDGQLVIFSGANDQCQSFDLNKTPQPLANNQAWIVEQVPDLSFAVHSVGMHSSSPVESATPSERCGAVSWCHLNESFVYGGFGFTPTSNSLQSLQDLWQFTYHVQPASSDSVIKAQDKSTSGNGTTSWFWTLPPKYVFLLIFTTASGLGILFGLILFLKKFYCDDDRHSSSSHFRVRYSQISEKALFEETYDS